MTTLDGCYKVDSIKEGPIHLYFMSRPCWDAFRCFRSSPHCAYGLYGVIHISPLWGDL